MAGRNSQPLTNTLFNYPKIFTAIHSNFLAKLIQLQAPGMCSLVNYLCTVKYTTMCGAPFF